MVASFWAFPGCCSTWVMLSLLIHSCPIAVGETPQAPRARSSSSGFSSTVSITRPGRAPSPSCRTLFASCPALCRLAAAQRICSTPAARVSLSTLFGGPDFLLVREFAVGAGECSPEADVALCVGSGHSVCGVGRPGAIAPRAQDARSQGSLRPREPPEARPYRATRASPGKVQLQSKLV